MPFLDRFAERPIPPAVSNQNPCQAVRWGQILPAFAMPVPIRFCFTDWRPNRCHGLCATSCCYRRRLPWEMTRPLTRRLLCSSCRRRGKDAAKSFRIPGFLPFQVVPDHNRGEGERLATGETYLGLRHRSAAAGLCRPGRMGSPFPGDYASYLCNCQGCLWGGGGEGGSLCLSLCGARACACVCTWYPASATL